MQQIKKKLYFQLIYCQVSRFGFKRGTLAYSRDYVYDKLLMASQVNTTTCYQGR